MIQMYPFFVYGTLISGQPNDFYWEDCIGTAEPAYFPNGRLFDMGSFPMLLEGDGGQIQGQLMVPVKGLSEDKYQLLVQRLDRLENYDPEDVDNSPYYRVLRTVFLENDQSVLAWVYLGRPSYTVGRPKISSGDWVSHSTSNQSHMLDWWQKHGHELFTQAPEIETKEED